ncbi:MAG: hypothetical protein N0A16_00050 [Blastocatellia bacterium]|nr:hypothetical protein [Blastocatellia bacterium]MCS7156101.1 hypothetical protein [Blastocatellia bacterium]MDW8169262.1 hypothetical protein [Acidobacteriota bacterium]MDW8256121.1 hypothetical protein [Acidobacteriota bacterium]
MERAHMNMFLHQFGESVRGFFRTQQRSQLLSPLFHLPGRLILGSYCYHEHLVALLGQVVERLSPEALAHRVKRLGARPNEIHINSLLLGYLNGREQKRLLGHLAEGEADEIAFLLDFWARFLSVYRRDGRLLPEEGGFTLPVLEDQMVERLLPMLRPEPEEARRRRLHRALATLDLLTFVFNGEARVGIFHHGPYPLSDGTCLLIKEQLGLQDDFYSWADESVRLPVAHLTCVMRLKDVAVRIGLFGSLWTDPKEYSRNVIAYGLFTTEEAGLRPVALEELEDIAARAADAQMRLYRRFLTWDDRRRIAYGAELYGNLLRVFGDQAGLGAAFPQEIRERFRESVERHLEALLAGEPPLILRHIAETEGEIYSPLE